jgi:hypothetical protein
MIKRQQALELMGQYHSDRLKNMKEVDMIIKVAASIGNGSVSFFYPKKTAMSLKNKLRINGFFVETLTFASIPDEEHIAVVWDNDMRSGEEVNREREE